jgi:hypothetical protein
MKWEKKIECLAARARAENPPNVDVAHKVLHILSTGQVEPVTVSEKPWMWLAALSSAVAVPAAVFVFTIYFSNTEPLIEISDAISWVLQ